MMKIFLALAIFSIFGMAGILAQTQYAVFQGPSHFMRLNEAGDDFVSIDNNETKGTYTFYHSYLDVQNPWSVVSEEGTNIYTKLNFKNVSDFKDVFMISPELQLLTSRTYIFSQAVFGMLNKVPDAGGLVKMEIQLLEGEPGDFSPDMLGENSSLKSANLRENTVTDFVVENIIPQTNGAHYFVVYFSNVLYLPGNAEGMSIGFKKNQVIDTYGTALNQILSKDLNVYPNPCSEHITIEGLSGKMKIFNLLGNCVKSLDDYQGEMLDISELEKGIYLVKSGQSIKRFVKN